MERTGSANRSWAALVHVREGEQGELDGLLRAASDQLPPPLDVVLVDSTLDGVERVLPRGVRRVRELSPSRGLAWRHAALATEATWIASFSPGARYARGRVARQLKEAKERTRVVTCDLTVRAAGGSSRDVRLFRAGWGEDLLGGYEAGLLLRRDLAASFPATCFAPHGLALLRSQRDAKQAAHAAVALLELSDDAFRASEKRAAEDARLLALGYGAPQQEHPDGPAVTVLLATHERRGVLLECLEGFARQDVPAGTHEIVVVDDASLDGTRELGEALELPVPLHFESLEQPGGATRARIQGLPQARGRLVLFVNDDTIPFPDTVRRHLEAHRELGEGRVIVLGTFEQPAEHRELALTRLVDASSLVFDYASWEPGQVVPGGAFYTCNLSAPLDAVREAGGFDPAFAMYAEDTDLGLRMEELGYGIHYRPECRAIHRHLFDFDWLRRRQSLVAKAHTTLFAKHPQRLIGSKWAELTGHRARSVLREAAGVLPSLEKSARALASLSAGASSGASATVEDCLEAGKTCLKEIVCRLNTVWWYEGFQLGFEAHGGRDLQDTATGWSPALRPEQTRTTLLRARGRHWPALVCLWLARHRAVDPSGVRVNEERPEALLVLCDQASPEQILTARRALAAILRRARRTGLPAPVFLASVNEEGFANALATASNWIPTGGPTDDRDGELAARAGCATLSLSPGEDSIPFAELRLLMWPRWTEESCARDLVGMLSPIAEAEHVQALLLFRDSEAPLVDSTMSATGSWARHCLPIEAPTTVDGWARLSDAVDLVSYDRTLPHLTDRLLGELERPVVASPEELAAELLAREASELPSCIELNPSAHV